MVQVDFERYAGRFEQSRRRLQAAAGFEEADMVPALAGVGGSFFCSLFGVNIRDYYTDLDTQIEVQSRGLQWRLENLNDDFTGGGLHYDAGPTAEGLVFDCEIVYPDNTSPRIVHFIERPEQIHELELVDPRDNPRVQEHLRRARQFADRVKELGLNYSTGHAGIGIHPPISCATAIADANWVYMLMSLEPELVQVFFKKCFDMFCLCQEYSYELSGGGPGSLGLADDNSAFVSDTMYREQVLPWNLALYEKYGGRHRYLHADGPNQHHYETYANLTRLTQMDIGGFSTLRPAVAILKPAGCAVYGNLNNRDLYAGFTPRLAQKVRQTLRLAGPGGGYLFAIGGEVYAGTPPDTLCRTFDYAREVGRYPLDLPEEPLPGEDDDSQP